MKPFLYLAALLSVVSSATFAAAQSYTGAEFYGYPEVSGFSPAGSLLQASDGNFYGYGYESGTGEIVYRLTPGGVMSVVYANPVCCFAPVELVQGTDGALYGISKNSQLIFKVTLSGAYTLLSDFQKASGNSNARPTSLVLDTEGNLDITADDGSLYSYNIAKSTLSLLHSGGLSYSPEGPLVETDDALYGAAAYNGYPGTAPAIFAESASGYKTLFQSDQASAPYNFVTPIVEGPDGFLYGIAQTPFGNEVSTCSSYIYRISTSGTAGGALAQLPGDCGFVEPPAFGSDGNLYGLILPVAESGSNLVFYQFELKTGALKTLASVTGSPYSGSFIQGSDGAFYFVGDSEIDRFGAPIGLAAQLPPPVQISFSPSTIAPGQSTVLTWNATNAFSDSARLCFASGSWSGSVAYSGSKNITVAKAGDYDYALTCGGLESSTAHLTVTSGQVASGTSLTLSEATGTVGDPITISAAVKAASGTGAAPTGRVTLLANGHPFTSLPLSAGAVRQQIYTAGFTPGPITISAAYGGDSAYAASTSGAESLSLAATPSLTFIATPNPATQSEPVTFQVVLGEVNGGPTPTGTVYLNNTLVNLTGGAVTYTTTASASSGTTEYVTVEYNGDSYYSPVTYSYSFNVRTQPDIVLKVSPASGAVGQTFTASATLTPSGGAPFPTGSVGFYANGEYLGSGTLSSGKATLSASTSGAPAGTYKVTAEYGGDTYNGENVSAPVSVTLTGK